MSTGKRTQKGGAEERSSSDRPLISTDSFWWPAGQVGCLLVHGFTGTPYEMQFLGEKLHAHGYSIYGVRLAGHGDAPEDLETLRWQDWYDSVEHGLAQLTAHCSTVVVIGLSLGGLLSLRLAGERPDAVSAVVLLAPALVLANPWPERLAGLFHLALPLLPRSWRSVRKRRSDISDPEARAIHPGSAAIPLRGVLEVLNLQTLVRTRLAEIRQPALALQGKRDRTVSAEGLAILEKGLANLRRTIVLPDSSHVITVDVEREQVVLEVTRFIEEVIGASVGEPVASTGGAP